MAARLKHAKIILAVIIIMEMATASTVGVAQFPYSSTDRVQFPWVNEEVQEVLAARRPMGSDFYRTDFTTRWNWNDPALYGTGGSISFFSSIANQNTIRFMQGFGLLARPIGNNYAWMDTSPLTGAVLNMQYAVHRSGQPADDHVFWSWSAQSGGVTLMQNMYRLPLGFMVGAYIVDYVGNAHNSFISQNDFFRLATGLEGDLFTLLNPNRIEGDGGPRFTRTIPRDAEIYAFARTISAGGVNIIFDDDRPSRHVTVYQHAPHIFRVGSFAAGDLMTLQADAGALFVGMLNREVFEQGVAQMAAQGWQLTHFSGTRVAGHIAAIHEGVMFTSIPYVGNWMAYVNGQRVDVIAIDGAMSAIHLPAGTHYVEFVYRNESFVAGLWISGASLILFAASLTLRRRKHER